MIFTQYNDSGMYLSTCRNQVEISKNELVNTSVCPSDKLDYSQITKTYQFRTTVYGKLTRVNSSSSSSRAIVVVVVAAASSF